MNPMLTIVYLLLVVSVKLFVTLSESMSAMKIKMVFVWFIAILWRTFADQR